MRYLYKNYLKNLSSGKYNLPNKLNKIIKINDEILKINNDILKINNDIINKFKKYNNIEDEDNDIFGPND